MRNNLIIFSKGIGTHFAKRLVRTYDLSTENPEVRDFDTSAYSGKAFKTDLSLGLTEAANDITLIAAVCKVTREYTVVETAVAGLNGTVKESISAQDYIVEINVTLASESDEYPEEQVRAVTELMNSGKPIFVSSDYLMIFDITTLVPSSFEVDTQQTDTNYQNLKLSFKSDDEYEIEVTS